MGRLQRVTLPSTGLPTGTEAYWADSSSFFAAVTVFCQAIVIPFLGLLETSTAHLLRPLCVSTTRFSFQREFVLQFRDAGVIRTRASTMHL